MPKTIKPGIYDKVVSKEVEQLIQAYRDLGGDAKTLPLDPAESHIQLSRYISNILEQRLNSVPGKDLEKLHLARRGM